MMNDPHQMDVITDQLAKRGQSVCGDSFIITQLMIILFVY